MKNRYIPFGYQIQNGDSVINTEQAATVQHIFYAYTEGQSFKEIAEYLTTSGTAYHFSDNSWNKNIVARILANEIYCGAKGYPAIISKEVYSQAASIRSNKTVTYSAVLKPFRSDMQCACCGERLYWRPRTQQWTCRQCGMWSKPMQPENMAQQIVDRLYQIQQHPEIIHNPKEQCNTRSIEVAQLDHEIHTALALPELDADAIIDKILRRAELQFNYCAAGDDDPTTMQIKRSLQRIQTHRYISRIILQLHRQQNHLTPRYTYRHQTAKRTDIIIRKSTMSNARIIEIPATRQIRSGKNNTMRKMRVAAYCRVSTEEEEQQGSFETAETVLH